MVTAFVFVVVVAVVFSGGVFTVDDEMDDDETDAKTEDISDM